MSQRRKLKGQKIGVQELLTPFTEHLVGKAKEMSQSAPWLKKVWTWDGRVICLVQYDPKSAERKVTVSCVEDLNVIWRKGKTVKKDETIKRRRRFTDQDYDRYEWQKTEKME